VEIVLADFADVAPAQTILAGISVDEVQVQEQTRRLTAGVTGGAEALRQVLQRLADANVAIVDVGLRRPTLDDVFLSLTGHAAEDEAEPEPQDGSAEKTEEREKEAVR
jgi:ABC-2 type transport system ATP-binding protein